MRRIFFIMIFTICTEIFMYSQDISLEDYTNIPDKVVNTKINLPIANRKIYGGTKIIPIFEGDWSNEAKGAFECACEIWEEALPSTLPIRITAIMDTQTSMQKSTTFSKITPLVIQDSSTPSFTIESLFSEMKGATFYYLSGYGNFCPYEKSFNDVLLEKSDIIIRYYNFDGRITNNCSFNLSGECDNQHFDFVTMVLRDIARGLGIMWRYRIFKDGNFIPSISIDAVTPFEAHIASAIIDGANVTGGSLHVTAKGFEGTYEFDLYALEPWDLENSLNYFIPNVNKKITQLLSYEFGRGTVIRDISSEDTYNMFRNLLC